MGQRVLLAGPEYWQERLAGAVSVDLPADRRRDPLSIYLLAEERLTLPEALLPAAGRAGAEAGLERFATMLAAWYAVLHRHTGQADLLVGTRLGYPAEGTPGSAGQPAMMLPLRTAFDPGGSFAVLVDRTRDAVLEAFDHADAVAGIDVAARFSAAGPSTWVGFSLLSTLVADGDGTALPPSWPLPAGPQFDVELAVDDTREETVLHLLYDTSRFSRPTALRLLRHFTAVLAEAAHAPQRPVRRLPLHDEPGPAPAWPLASPRGYQPAPPAAAGQSLVGRFQVVAARYPDRVAVSGASGEYRYGELDRVSTVLAGTVLGRRVTAGQRVAVLCDHDVGLAVALWSVLKAGAAYVPLDPRQPDSRLARIAADAQVSAVVCDSGLARRAAGLVRGKPVVPLIDPGLAAIGRPAADVPPHSLAYLLHTSGTTGGPKGVMQTHANVLAHALTYANRMRLHPLDRITFLATFTFDLAVMDFFGALLTGASLHIADPFQPAAELWSRLGGQKVSVLHCTPTLFRHLLSGLSQAQEPGSLVPDTMRLVVLGGERVTVEDLRAFLACFPERCALVSGLSATECSVAFQHLASRRDLTASAVPVGHPVDGLRVRLLDDEGLPTEVFGELEILSDRVALGYWNQPEATAAAFGEYPGGQRFYRTGDLARRLPDGALVHCGRKDRQVKIRGHRVEPGEIEGLLRAHPTVAQAAVLVDQGTGMAGEDTGLARQGPAPATRGAGGPRLIAYATSATSVPLDADELAAYLRRQLPDYAVPTLVLALDAMPVGATGKLDYARLPLPGPEAAPLDDAPSSPLELAVAGIWCELLGLTKIGVRASFMASGGDSILLMAMMAKIRRDLGADLLLMDILKNPTVGGIADLVERSGRM